MAQSEVVQNDPYAEIDDVEEIFEGRQLTGGNEGRLQRRLLQVSETIDKRTNRAWRKRRLSDYEGSVRFNHRQKRGSKSYGGRRWPMRHQDYRALFKLPNPNVRNIESITLVYPTNEETLDPATDIGPDKALQLDEERGLLRPKVSLFTSGTAAGRTNSRGRTGVNTDARMRVTYTYGKTSVPYDIQRACALLTAADAISTDQNSTVVAGGDDDGMSMAEGARQWRKSANKIINRYRYVNAL